MHFTDIEASIYRRGVMQELYRKSTEAATGGVL